MNFLDMKTVIFSQILSNTVCALVMVFLWRQNRRRFPGLTFWLIDYALQVVAIILIAARGGVPDFLSMVGSNTAIIGGTILLYIGLQRFVGKPGPQVHNYLYLAVFVGVHSYFVVVEPNLAARSFNLTLGILIISSQCAWLMLRQVDAGMRPITRGVGVAFGSYCVLGLIRIIEIAVVPKGNDFFQSGAYDTLIVLLYQMLFIGLTLNLVLLVNGRWLEEHRRVEKALRESEDRYRQLVLMSPDGILVHREGKFVFANPAAIRLFGASSPEQLIGAAIMDRVHPDDRATIIERIQNIQEHAETAPLHEEKFIRFDGQSFAAEVLGIPIVFEGKPGVLVIGRDVTERSQIETALRESERKLKTLFAILPVGISILDAEQKIVLTNPALENTLAVSAAGLQRGDYRSRQYLRPDGTPMSNEELASARAIREQHAIYNVEMGVVKEDGQTIWVNVSAVPVAFPDWRVVIATTDITKRKRAEEALHTALEEAQQRSRETTALLKSARAILTHRDFELAARAIFDSARILIGATGGYVALLSPAGSENEVLFLESGGRPCSVDPCLPMPIRGLRGVAYQERKTVYDNDFPNSEWEVYRPAGHVTLENVLFAPLSLDGNAVGLLGLANKPGGFTETDARMATAFGELAAIALRNSRTLAALENSEARFRSVAESAMDAVILANQDGHIISWNYGAQMAFGYTGAEVLGRPITLLMPENYLERHLEAIQRLVETGTKRTLGQPYEVRGRHKNGHEFPLEISPSSWEIGGERFYSAIGRDISERKQAEQEQLRLAQTVAAHEERQRLARDLHDTVKQSLFSAGLTADVLPLLFERDLDQTRVSLTQVRQLIHSAQAELQLLMFELRPQFTENNAVTHLLRELVETFARRAGLPVELSLAEDTPLSPDAQMVFYRTAQEALSNIAKHARANAVVVKLLCRPPDAVELLVSDNGCGFDPDRIPSGHLGLLGMRERATAIDATLAITTQIGRGTEIKLAWFRKAAEE